MYDFKPNLGYAFAVLWVGCCRSCPRYVGLLAGLIALSLQTLPTAWAQSTPAADASTPAARSAGSSGNGSGDEAAAQVYKAIGGPTAPRVSVHWNRYHDGQQIAPSYTSWRSPIPTWCGSSRSASRMKGVRCGWPP